MGIVWAIKDYWETADDIQEQINKLGEVIISLSSSPNRDELLKQYGVLEASYKRLAESIENMLDAIDEKVRL